MPHPLSNDLRERVAGFVETRHSRNEVRPHSAIGNKPPMALMNCSELHGPV